MARRAFAVVAFLLIALSFGLPAATAGAGCHGGQFSDARGSNVNLTLMCFTPTVIRIQPGQKVTWANHDTMPHTVTGAGYLWGSTNELGMGRAISFRFASSGVYPYFCMLHPGMVGAVVVGDGTSSGTTTQDVAPAANTPAPPAGTITQAPASARGVSEVWRVAAITAFGLLLAGAVVLATLAAVARGRRTAARA
jgi:plastocyanin